jgi:sn-glycerol 3-phosphate transport system substrate-binding protein
MAIQFWHGLQQGPVLETFKRSVHEYNSKHTECPVELRDFTIYGAPVTEGLSKNDEEQPQLVLAPEFKTSEMMSALKEKKVIPINELIDKELLEDIAEIVKYTFGVTDGNLASLPLNPACGVIYTNKDLLKAIGRDPDFVPESMEQLEEVCRDLIEKGCTPSGYTCAWPPAYLIEIPAAQQDFPLVLPSNGKLGYGEYQLGQKWLVQHLLNLREQQKKGIFRYAGQDNDSRKPFIERKVAFFMQGSTHYPILQKEANASEQPFEIGCGPLPTLAREQTVKYAFPLGGASIWVLNNTQTTKMIEGVRSFLTYLAEKEFQTRWHQETAYVPVRKTLPRELEDFYKDHPIHRAVVSQTIEAVLGTYSFGIHAPNYSEARKEIFTLIEKVLDTTTVDEEVEGILKKFDEKFSIPPSSANKM